MAIKIYIDQGHNPEAPNAGAEANGLREQDLVFRIGILLAERLRQNPEFSVMLSRPTAETQLGTSNAGSLRVRVEQAIAFGADLLLSLHTNASVSPTPSGSEALVFQANSVAYDIAEDLLFQLNLATGLRNRGVVLRPGLYILRRSPMPAVLVELGFISNPEDATLMRDRPDLFADGLYRGLLMYYNL